MQVQDASGEFLIKAWPWFEANRQRLVIGTIAVAVLIGVMSFVSSQRAQKEVSAGVALSQLLSNSSVTPDQLLQFANSQSGTQAANRAQLQAAMGMFAAGRYADAEVLFQKFADDHVGNALAVDAILGEGASLEAQGNADLALNAYNKALAVAMDGPASVVANFALGRISEQQGKLTQAQTYFQEVVRHGSQISLASEAYQHLQDIRLKLATQPATLAPAQPTTLSAVK